MVEPSRFRIYYANGPETESEEIVATGLADAVQRAEARRTRACAEPYFEIWQGANMLFASNDGRVTPSLRLAT